MKEGALVTLVESIYAVDLDDRTWFQQVVCATAELCGLANSYLGFFYDASDPEALNVWNVCAAQFPPELQEVFQAWQQTVRPDLVMKTFRSLHVGSTRKTGLPYRQPLLDHRERVGWGDIMNINGLDPSGIGCLLTIGTREREFSASPGEMVTYTRIAHHLAAAFRYRRRLGITQLPGAPVRGPDVACAEAIFDIEGRVTHAEGEAAGSTARERLGAAVQAIEKSRTKARRPGRGALELSHPLVDARWTLVDGFEDNGRRYLVARDNQAHARDFERLPDRERQVVLQAALGFTNKEIAYSLGISHSTVRVLMARAARKIGVRSRKELMSHPTLSQIRGEVLPTPGLAAPPRGS